MDKILVVEDSESIREELCEILLLEGFKVVSARNGKKGFLKAKKELPDLIVSDVSMPKLSGYKLLTKLKRSKKTKSIPFIFLSGKNELPDLRMGMNLGADDYLLKPINTDELIKVIRSKLSKQQSIKDNLNKLVDENKYLLREAGRMAKIGYWVYDKQTDVYSWSKAVHEIFGTKPKDGIPANNVVLNCFKEASKQKFVEAICKLKVNGVAYDIELEMTNFNNEKRWVQDIGEAVYNDKNEITGARGVIRDITNLKNNEEELKKSKKVIEKSLKVVKRSEFLLKEGSSMAKFGAYEVNSKKNSFFFSDEIYSIFHLTLEKKHPLKTMRKAFKKDSEVVLIEAVKECMEKGIPFDLELELEFIEKPTAWVRMITKPIYDENKGIIGRRGIIQDITNKKISQLQLELSNKKIQTSLKLVEENEYSLKEAGRMAKVGYWKYNKQTEIVVWSEAVHEIWGTDSKEGVPKMDVILSVFNEESKKQLLEAIENLNNNKVSYDIELPLTNLKSEERWIRNIGEPIYNDKNEVIGRRGVAQDITEQKTKQNELDQRRERLHDLSNALNEAQQLGNVGSWYWDLASDKIEWSDETYHIWGFNPKKSAPDLDAVINLIHIDDQELFKSTVAASISHGTPYDIEHRICLANNEEKIIRAIGKAVFGDNNKVIRLKGTTQDITEQKRIKSEIEEAQEMYRLLTNNSNDLICLQEIDSTFKYISPSIKNILGYEQSDFLGEKVFSIVHDEDIQAFEEAIKEKIFRKKNMEAYTFRVRHKEGHFVWLEFLTSPAYKDEKISYFITSARDVTQWVLAKQEIKRKTQLLSKLTTKITLVEEDQKKEIASNIHDHLSQSLIISKMRINVLKRNPELKMIDEDLKFIETHISDALENSRRITYELSPPVLYQLGIIAALNWLLEDVENTHKIECRFKSNISSVELDDVKSILLFRSIQEVITNAIKYANASLITLNVEKNKHELDILITDNGAGFDTDVLNNHGNNHSGSGFGLFTVKERISNIEGKFKIVSEINVGTIIKIIVPLK